jgi:hypothetical protein
MAMVMLGLKPLLRIFSAWLSSISYIWFHVGTSNFASVSTAFPLLYDEFVENL